jgi:hypothetical protein
MTTPQYPHVFPDHLDLISIPETPAEAAWLLEDVPDPERQPSSPPEAEPSRE